MAKYRGNLPQLGGELFLTDGGLETTLIFLEGWELPEFASFPLIRTPEGEAALRKYFRPYLEMARTFGTGFILESITWRASPDWGRRLGFGLPELAEVNRRAINQLEEFRQEFESESSPMVISACIGPRGDGYIPGQKMSAEEAEAYHREQVEWLADTVADFVSAMTMNTVEEAIGIAHAARRANMPVVLSFTVETDGRLPTGQALRSAIEEVEDVTAGYPAYYMLNCAHPTHFDFVLDDEGLWKTRLRGLRANSSCKSHAELNDSTELDAGNPAELGQQYAALLRRLPQLNILGGCCGTDHRHIEQIATACTPLFR